MPRKRTNIPENYKAPLPSRLRYLMGTSGHTQADLASHLGISRQSVSAYMDGSANPTPMAIVRIANFLGVSTDYLLGNAEYQKQETSRLNAEDIGLSENAASILQYVNTQNDKSKLIVLNYLIENKVLLEKIASYLAFSAKNIAQSKQFSLIPYDRRNMDGRLFFADIVENLQKFQSDFLDSIKEDEKAIEQMAFSIISKCVDDNIAGQWCQLLYDCQNNPDKHEQLSMIAKFLRFYGYADFMNRVGCNLEQFIFENREEESENGEH